MNMRIQPPGGSTINSVHTEASQKNTQTQKAETPNTVQGPSLPPPPPSSRPGEKGNAAMLMKSVPMLRRRTSFSSAPLSSRERALNSAMKGGIEGRLARAMLSDEGKAIADQESNNFPDFKSPASEFSDPEVQKNKGLALLREHMQASNDEQMYSDLTTAAQKAGSPNHELANEAISQGLLSLDLAVGQSTVREELKMKIAVGMN